MCVDWVVCLRYSLDTAVVEYQLMSKQIDIDPVITGPSESAPQNVTVESPCRIKLLGGQCEMKWPHAELLFDEFLL